MEKEIIVHEDPKSPISEMFRTLRTNIQFMNGKEKVETILVTSTLPREGKSFVSANLSIAFAQVGKRVILVDADMRKGRQHHIFDLKQKPGLSNLLSGISEEEEKLELEDYLQITPVDNLLAIAAGNVPPNPSELLVSDAMMSLIESLKQMCDILIIDGPPTSLVTDSLILTRMVDSTIIVAASKETKKENLRKTIEGIKNVGGKIAGIVLNKIDIPTKQYKQSYYYGTDRQDASIKNTNGGK